MAGPELATAPATGTVFDRRLLLLALVPFAVYLFFYLVLMWVRPDDVRFEIIAARGFRGVAALEAHYRYLWVSAFLLSCAASFTVAASSALSLFAETPARDRRLVFGLALAVLTAVVVVEVMGDRWYVYLGEVSGDGIGLYHAVFRAPPRAAGTQSVLSMLDWGLNVVKVLGATALILVTLALILTLARRAGPPSSDQSAQQLAHAQARQRTYLQQSATVYVFALIAMMSWMYWPLPFLADEGQQAAYRQLVVGAALVQGVGYSLAIAAIYLPPALLLRHRVAALASDATGDAGSVETWLQTNGLEIQPLDQLRQVATLLMPTLVSILPALKELWQ